MRAQGGYPVFHNHTQNLEPVILKLAYDKNLIDLSTPKC